MPGESPKKKKPFLSRRIKRLLVSLALFFSLPIVLMGALTQQNTEQEAAEIEETPNIILIQTENQRAESITTMPTVAGELGGTGVTFTNAIASSDGFVLGSQLLDQFTEAGYTTKILGGESVPNATVVKDALDFLSSVSGAYVLHVTLHADSELSCGETSTVINPAVNEADVSDKPRDIQALPRLSAADLKQITVDSTRHECGLQEVDTAVGEVLRSLGDEREHTVIIYAGKNGYAWGEQRLVGANCLYDACLHVPLVMSYPHLTPTRVISDDVVSPVDVSATIASLVGVESNTGRSLVPLLLDPRESVRGAALLEARDDTGAMRSSAIRTKEWKYIEHATGEKELYDLVSDPHELTNLSRNALYAAQAAELKAQLTTLQGEE